MEVRKKHQTENIVWVLLYLNHSGKQKEYISSGDIVEPSTIVIDWIIENSITPTIENQGVWEADPYQLP